MTLRAMVVESDAVWFEDGSPLTQKLCEDMRQPDDVAPQLNYDCQICDEAKYEASFHILRQLRSSSRSCCCSLLAVQFLSLVQVEEVSSTQPQPASPPLLGTHHAH